MSNNDQYAIPSESPWRQFYPNGVSIELEKLPWSNLSELCRETASRFGDKTAYTICLANGMSASLTFNEIERYSNALAAYL